MMSCHLMEEFSLIQGASPAPLYQQIKDQILNKIKQGHWLPGYKIPSENELLAHLKVSRMTVNRALQELTYEGQLDRVAGVGTFVAKPQRHASLIELQDIAEEITARGHVHRAKVLWQTSLEAPKAMVARMQLAGACELFYLQVIHYQDERPIQLESRYVNPKMVPNFMSLDWTVQTATSYLMQLMTPDEMEHVVEAVKPDNKTRKLLQLEENEPCLKLSRRTWKNAQVVTCVDLIYPGYRYTLGARYLTNHFRKTSGAK